MRYLRCRFNYILWALYGLVICIYFTAQISLICTMLDLGWPYYFLGTAGCALLLVLAVYTPVHMLAEKRAEVRPELKHAQLWECLFLIFAIAAALLLRLWMASSGGTGLYGDKSLYIIAAATAGQPVRLTGLHFNEIFLFLLTCLFSMIGVWENNCILLQLALQIAAIALLYPAVRMIAGKIAAVAAVTAAALLPVYVEYCLSATPEGLRMLCFSLLLLIVGAMLGKLKKCGRKSAAAGLILFLAGFAAGIFSFLDYYFLSVFLLGLLGILYLERRGVRAKTRIKETAAFFIAALCGFAGALCLRLFLFGGSVAEVLQEWFLANMESGQTGWASLAGREALFYFLPLLFSAFFYVFGFFEQKGNLGIIWTLPFTFLLISDLIFGTSLEKQTITLLFWGVFAGMGVHSMCCFEKDKNRKNKEKPSLPKKRRHHPGASEKEASAQASFMAVGIEARLEAPAGSPLPGEPIPNPLPGPKKHVQREMDFAYEPKEEEMCFDIDRFEEGDDFDLL